MEPQPPSATQTANPKSSPCPCRPRFRTQYTSEQVLELESEYQKSQYIGSGRRAELAQDLNLPAKQIKIWFQNRRMKEKRNAIVGQAMTTQNVLRCLSPIHVGFRPTFAPPMQHYWRDLSFLRGYHPGYGGFPFHSLFPWQLGVSNAEQKDQVVACWRAEDACDSKTEE